MPRSTSRVLTRVLRVLIAAILSLLTSLGQPAVARDGVAAAPKAAGVLRLRSAHSVQVTVERLKTAVQSKGIRFFDAIDQQALGKSAELKISPSTLVLFGNPPLGVQFLQSNRYAALDWPVRMLVTEEADGSVWLAWTDFSWLAKRYAIKDKDAAFKMASAVAASLATEAAK
ncbi:MAG: chromosome condensation protein CrcB [Hyphomicrobium sp.]|nr:MAG: chromosome condensation protein CrcB [Hyphomicrobium sp.]